MTLEFAVKTPLQHSTWSEVLEVWRAADEMDVFESAWTMDHLYPLTPPAEGPIFESWTSLAALAQATKRLRLGSMVNGMHFRHPGVTAAMAATLDHISGGRFHLGLGAGWFEGEAEAYGIPLGSMTQRFDRFAEGVEVIVSLLGNEKTTFHGRYYDLKDARCEPKPVQPKIPIVIGGKGPKRTLPIVARWADQWDSTSPESPAWWRALADRLDECCGEIGRDPAQIRRSVHLMWSADADAAAIVADAVALGEVGVDLVIFSMRGPYDVRLLDPLARAIDAVR